MNRSFLANGAEIDIFQNGGRQSRRAFYFQSLLRERIIDGIDIVGSLLETDEPSSRIDSAKVRDISNQLNKILDFCSQENLVLRIHAFENANVGNFYEALKTSLRAYSQPISVRIGHINKVTAEWLNIFADLDARVRKGQPPQTDIGVAIDACTESNHVLQGSRRDGLYQIIEDAKAKGLRVYYGADGRGIISGSSVLEQYQIFDEFTFANKKQPLEFDLPSFAGAGSICSSLSRYVSHHQQPAATQ